MCQHKKQLYEFGGFRLNAAEHLLQCARGQRVLLTPKAMETLIVLVERSGHVVSKEELMQAVWHDSFVEESSLTRNISALRKALGQSGSKAGFIETVPKVGYRFSADVRRHAIVTETASGAAGEDARASDAPDELFRPAAAVDTGSAGFVQPAADPGARSSNRRRALPLAAAAIGLALLLALTGWNYRADRPPAEPGSLAAGVRRLTEGPNNHEYPVWTADSRIRFISRDKNKQVESFIINADGSGRTRIDNIRDLSIGFWSPDGRRVVYGKKNDRAMYLADADGANEKKLPFYFAANIDWSPDGQRLVLQSDEQLYTPGTPKNDEIYVYTLETDEFVNISRNPAFDGDPSWSPDGRQIAFNSNRDGNFEIYLMDPDGSRVRRLTHSPDWDSFPVFSPDGTLISFNSGGEDVDIYVMRTDGSLKTKLTDWESNEGIRPGAWSPDGTKIAFISDRAGNRDVYVMEVEPFPARVLIADDAADLGEANYSADGARIVYQAELRDGTGELRIFDVKSRQSRVLLKTPKADLRPVFSPDGTRIAFQNRVEGQTEIFLIDPDGRRLVNISNYPAGDFAPFWAPGGDRLVFLTNRGDDSSQHRLYTMNPDGSDQRPLTPRAGWEYDASWSPDGSLIAFACDRLDAPENLLDICLINADGSGERRLLSHRSHDYKPRWSPDGRRLAFVSHAAGNPEIYLMNADGTGLLRLTRHAGVDSFPAWSPDGRRIIFSSDRNGRFALYEVEVP